MKASGAIGALALAAALLTGCVDRRFVVTTDPPGAIVYRDGVYLGATRRRSLHLLCKYHFMIVKEGYETLQVDQEIKTPWYEFPGIDFLSETLLPYNVVDRREFHYKLEPRKLPDEQQFLQQAQALRKRGLDLGPGKLALTGGQPPAPPVVLPPPGILPIAPPDMGGGNQPPPVVNPTTVPGPAAQPIGGTTPNFPPGTSAPPPITSPSAPQG